MSVDHDVDGAVASGAAANGAVAGGKRGGGADAGLRARHDALVAGGPPLRIRERAARLGVPEAQLVSEQLGVAATPLAGPAQRLFRELGSIGRVMALTRNDWCVHERHGRYEKVMAEGPVGLVLGPDIDLRMFFEHWGHAWAVAENGRASLQFFDGAGCAIHKVYRTDETDAAAWDALIERFARPDAPAPSFAPIVEPAAPDRVGDRAALRARWLALQDTHDFAPMLRDLDLSRHAAIAGVGADLAQQVPNQTVEAVLQAAADTALPIMCFVGNRSMIQIHSGPVAKLMRTGPWYNVLDPTFNLHLNTAAIADSWIVNKPSRDGWITSLELFTADGTLIVQFFGARKPGIPEQPAWRALLAERCPEPLHG
ncbi:MAG: hemin-degrading factor [Lautropia sp.]